MASSVPIPGTGRSVSPNASGAVTLVLVMIGFALLFLLIEGGAMLKGLIGSVVPGPVGGGAGSIPVRRVEA